MEEYDSADVAFNEDWALARARNMLAGMRLYKLTWEESDTVRDELVERIASQLRALDSSVRHQVLNVNPVSS